MWKGRGSFWEAGQEFRTSPDPVPEDGNFCIFAAEEVASIIALLVDILDSAELPATRSSMTLPLY